MYTITKQFTFEASHRLLGLPVGHQCGRLHGHSYRVEVELQSSVLNEHGFVVDYGELSEFADFLKTNFDHQDLNSVFYLQNVKPTAENIARVLYEHCKHWWKETVAVRVSETQKTWAEYRP